MNVLKMIRMIKAFINGAPLGDVAAMKIDALRTTPAAVHERLKHLSGKTVDIDVRALKALPDGTLGHEYQRHLEANHLEHLVLTPEITEQLQDNPYAILFTQTHDLHHVLTGFDTSVAGEIGVAAFNMGQGVGPLTERTWKIVSVLYYFTAPSQIRAIRHNMQLGYEMGSKAKLLIAEPLQDMLSLPLADARSALMIDESDARHAMPGGTSWITKCIYWIAGR